MLNRKAVRALGITSYRTVQTSAAILRSRKCSACLIADNARLVLLMRGSSEYRVLNHNESVDIQNIPDLFSSEQHRRFS